MPDYYEVVPIKPERHFAVRWLDDETYMDFEEKIARLVEDLKINPDLLRLNIAPMADDVILMTDTDFPFTQRRVERDDCFVLTQTLGDDSDDWDDAYFRWTTWSASSFTNCFENKPEAAEPGRPRQRHDGAAYLGAHDDVAEALARFTKALDNSADPVRRLIVVCAPDAQLQLQFLSRPDSATWTTLPRGHWLVRTGNNLDHMNDTAYRVAYGS